MKKLLLCSQFSKTSGKITALQNVVLTALTRLSRVRVLHEKELRKYKECWIILNWVMESIEGMGDLLENIKKDLMKISRRLPK